MYVQRKVAKYMHTCTGNEIFNIIFLAEGRTSIDCWWHVPTIVTISPLLIISIGQPLSRNLFVPPNKM